MLAHIITPTSITVLIDGIPHVADASHPNFDRIGDAIRAGDWDTVPDLIDIERAVKDFVDGDLSVSSGVVYYQDEPLHNAATERLISLMAQGYTCEPILEFLKRIVNNPDPRAVSGLYEWLERGNLPLTEDGFILAYKIVADDYKDIYTGKFDNSVGAVVEMPRFRVDADPERTCSAGLHFCSAEYLPAYGGGGSRVMLVKVDPADVVAFPRDYNISKGRCCRYEVVQELPRELAGSYFDNADAVYQLGANEEELEDDDFESDDEVFPVSIY